MPLQDNLNSHLGTSLCTETLYRNVGPLSVPFESRYRLKLLPGNSRAQNIGDSFTQNSVINSSVETYLNQAYSDPRQRNAWHGLTIGLSGIGAKDKFNKKPPPQMPVSLTKDYKTSKTRLSSHQRGLHFPEKDLKPQISRDKKRLLERVLIRDMLWTAKGSKERNPYVVQFPSLNELNNPSSLTGNQSNHLMDDGKRERCEIFPDTEAQLRSQQSLAERYERIISEKKRRMQEMESDDEDDKTIDDIEFDQSRQLMKYPFQDPSSVGYPKDRRSLRPKSERKFSWRQPRGQCSTKRDKPSDYSVGVHRPESYLTDRYDHISEEFKAMIDRIVGKKWNKLEFGEYDIRLALMKLPRSLTVPPEGRMHCAQWNEDWAWRQPRPICCGLDLLMKPQLLALPYYQRLLSDLKRANNEEVEGPKIKRAFLSSDKAPDQSPSYSIAALSPIKTAELLPKYHISTKPKDKAALYPRNRHIPTAPCRSSTSTPRGESPSVSLSRETGRSETESFISSPREEATRSGGNDRDEKSERSRQQPPKLGDSGKSERESVTSPRHKEAVRGRRMDLDTTSKRSDKRPREMSRSDKSENESVASSRREEGVRGRRKDRDRTKTPKTYKLSDKRPRDLSRSDKSERESVTSPRRDSASSHRRDSAASHRRDSAASSRRDSAASSRRDSAARHRRMDGKRKETPKTSERTRGESRAPKSRKGSVNSPREKEASESYRMQRKERSKGLEPSELSKRQPRNLTETKKSETESVASSQREKAAERYGKSRERKSQPQEKSKSATEAVPETKARSRSRSEMEAIASPREDTTLDDFETCEASQSLKEVSRGVTDDNLQTDSLPKNAPTAQSGFVAKKSDYRGDKKDNLCSCVQIPSRKKRRRARSTSSERGEEFDEPYSGRRRSKSKDSMYPFSRQGEMSDSFLDNDDGNISKQLEVWNKPLIRNDAVVVSAQVATKKSDTELPSCLQPTSDNEKREESEIQPHTLSATDKSETEPIVSSRHDEVTGGSKTDGDDRTKTKETSKDLKQQRQKLAEARKLKRESIASSQREASKGRPKNREESHCRKSRTSEQPRRQHWDLVGTGKPKTELSHRGKESDETKSRKSRLSDFNSRERRDESSRRRKHLRNRTWDDTRRASDFPSSAELSSRATAALSSDTKTRRTGLPAPAPFTRLRSQSLMRRAKLHGDVQDVHLTGQRMSEELKANIELRKRQLKESKQMIVKMVKENLSSSSGRSKYLPLTHPYSTEMREKERQRKAELAIGKRYNLSDLSRGAQIYDYSIYEACYHESCWKDLLPKYEDIYCDINIRSMKQSYFERDRIRRVLEVFFSLRSPPSPWKDLSSMWTELAIKHPIKVFPKHKTTRAKCSFGKHCLEPRPVYKGSLSEAFFFQRDPFDYRCDYAKVVPYHHETSQVSPFKELENHIIFGFKTRHIYSWEIEKWKRTRNTYWRSRLGRVLYGSKHGTPGARNICSTPKSDITKHKPFSRFKRNTADWISRNKIYSSEINKWNKPESMHWGQAVDVTGDKMNFHNKLKLTWSEDVEDDECSPKKQFRSKSDKVKSKWQLTMSEPFSLSKQICHGRERYIVCTTPWIGSTA